VAKFLFARRLARALSIFTFSCLALSAATGSARADMTANDCLGFEQEEADKELVYHAKNACERQLDCRLSYLVRCEDHDGKITSSSQQRMAFVMTKNGARDLSLSAKQCKQGWTISDIAWSCF
jgi:hypothetical protein